MLGPELPPERLLPEGAAQRFQDGALRISLSLAIYSTDAIFRSCYWLTDHCYVYLAPGENNTIAVTLLAKSGEANTTEAYGWRFLNDLIDQQLRISVNRETAAIREMIVTQAFAEVDVINDRGNAPHEEKDGPPNTEEIRKWRPVP